MSIGSFSTYDKENNKYEVHMHNEDNYSIIKWTNKYPREIMSESHFTKEQFLNLSASILDIVTNPYSPKIDQIKNGINFGLKQI